MKLRTRFVLAVTALVGLLGAIGYFCAYRFARVSHGVGDALSDHERGHAVLGHLARAAEEEDDGLLLLLAGDSQRGKRQVAAERQAFDAAAAQLGSLRDPVGSPERSRELRRAMQRYRGDADRLLAMPPGDEARDFYLAQLVPDLHEVELALKDLREARDRGIAEVAAWARDEAEHAKRAALLASLAGLLLALGVAVHLDRLMLRPIRELTQKVDALGSGDFSGRVAVRRRDELGELSLHVNHMAEALAEFRRIDLGEVLRAKDALSAALAALPDAVLIVTTDGRIESANPRARALLRGFGLDETVSASALPLPEAARVALSNALSGGASAPAPLLDGAMSATLDGDSRRLLPRALPIGGARAGAVLVFYDVTELAKLDELRLEFVGTASHELRTPLTTLRMMLALLGERAERLGASEREMLSTALLGCEQLSATVEAFLDITRAETSELLLARESLAIDELVHDAERLFRPRCEEAGVELLLTLRGPEQVEGDRARLRAVLSNLLGNALKYTPAGGSIAICADAGPHGSLALSISDTGPGVPQEYRARIFERYFRVEHHSGARSRGLGAGAGIGLYLSRKIVEAHGGSIHCRSGQRGLGTRMVVELPLRAPEAAKSA